MVDTVSVRVADQPAQVDLTVVQNATFSASFTWLSDGIAQPLAGYSATLTVARRAGGEPIFSVTSAGGEIILEPNNQTGTLDVEIPYSKTALLTKNGRYDLVLVENAPTPRVVRMVEGAVIVDRSVTAVA